MSKQIITEQRVVRTYPRGYTQTIDCLREALEKGYNVVHCNKIGESLEYIVERKREIEVEDE